MSIPIIELNGVQKKFSTEFVETYAIRELNLIVYQGEYISISGQSGSGKSTLLSILGLLDRPTHGIYKFNGKNVNELTRKQRAFFRNRKLGFVFQSFNLISDLTVEENVMLPLLYRNEYSIKECRLRAITNLKKLGIKHRAKHYPSQLSGGQQQRVALARALVVEPSLLLADEPTGNLDSKHTNIIMDIFQQLNYEGTTICMVTHSSEVAVKASKQVIMSDGFLREGVVNVEGVSV